MGKFYAFTNENVNSFRTLYNFNDARVLSVLGSGDQYFTSILNGAKEVELYDVNGLAWYYFNLKFYGIMLLSYEEFFEFFVTKRMSDMTIYNKLRPYLPSHIRMKLDCFYQNDEDISKFVLFCPISRAVIENRNANIIPYFDKDRYYQLQAMLINRKLPTFYLENLANMPNRVADKNYDLILTSNIFIWMYAAREENAVMEYKKLLESFNCPEIQAYYGSGETSFAHGSENYYFRQFMESGFEISLVESANVLVFAQDRVVSLRRTK